MSVKIIAALLALFFISNSLEVAKELQTQYVPISKRYPGIDLPAQNSLVTVELVYDPTCGDCTPFDKIWQQVVDSLAQSHPGKFSYRYAIQVLPHRILSFKCAQAIRYVNDKKSPQDALKLLQYFVANFKTWSEEAILNTPLSTTLDNLAQQVSSQTGLPQAEIRAQISQYADYDYETRKWEKYAMGTLHAAFTPVMFVNGARLDGAFNTNAQQIIDILTALI